METGPLMAPAVSPNPPQSPFDEGYKHHLAGRLTQAEFCYRRQLILQPHHPDSLHLLGMIAFHRGELEIAAVRIQHAIALLPTAPSYHSNLGTILHKQGLARDAGAAYLQALRLNPNLAEVHANLATLFFEADQLEQAVLWYRKALILRPGLPSAHRQLGDALRKLRRLDESALAYEQAVSLNPADAEAHNCLGRVRRELGDLPAALLSFRTALALNPQHPRAGFEEALVLLLQGERTAGWRAYERRWSSSLHATPARHYPIPQWSGQSLATGSVLLWPEQGVGDEIMFAGHLPDALPIGTPCVLACDPRLQPLFARSFPAFHVIPDQPTATEPLPSYLAAHLPIGSLPGLVPDHRPSGPYLVPDPVLRTELQSRYSNGGRLIGLAWYSKDPKTGVSRSIPLSDLSPLFTASGNRWISLQYGNHADLLNQAASTPLYLDPTIDQLADLDAFAAQVAAMDLVITIDNTTAHLAGALGVPVWLLLPFAPDWRWLAQGETSPWYRSMRLFRQPSPGDWTSVLEEVARQLLPCSPACRAEASSRPNASRQPSRPKPE